MSSPSGSGSQTGDGSPSSSVVYDHEPFIAFNSRVLDLATSTIWPGSPSTDIRVERLKGGGFNRVIGLARQSPGAQPGDEGQFILRVPRFEAAKVGNQVAILDFIHQHTAIPAPEVLTFDETEGTDIGSPYIVQNRIAGVDLHSSFPKLGHEQKCRVARELGGVFKQILSVRSSVSGRLVLSMNGKSGKRAIHVAPFWLDSTSLALTKPYGGPLADESTKSLLTTAFLSRKSSELERNTLGTVGSRLWDRFCEMTAELERGGWLTDRWSALSHLDLAPRNILVDPTDDERLPIITGILDWDSAVLAPLFMSCALPAWIWAWQEDEDEDERTANDTPTAREGRQLKALFEESAGNDYMRLAYEPAYRLARRLVRFAINGLRSNEDFREAKAMLQEWKECQSLYREKGFVLPEQKK